MATGNGTAVSLETVANAIAAGFMPTTATVKAAERADLEASAVAAGYTVVAKQTRTAGGDASALRQREYADRAVKTQTVTAANIWALARDAGIKMSNRITCTAGSGIAVCHPKSGDTSDFVNVCRQAGYDVTQDGDVVTVTR